MVILVGSGEESVLGVVRFESSAEDVFPDGGLPAAEESGGYFKYHGEVPNEGEYHRFNNECSANECASSETPTQDSIMEAFVKNL